ncbi:MAG: glycosyltransferase family 39 protein [Candidatus Woesebacteria bacterium]|nr:MAG: glycosyltransferase family 39 protein [Candidatus Woesebacteria bacterium]
MNKSWLKILIFTFLIGAVIWAGKGIFKYSIFSTHDGDHHIARVFDVIQTAKEGQFPLRWAGSLDYFCGVPIYNFFYPLIYYLAAAIYPFAKDVIFTLKIINFLSLLLGTLFFYFWIRTETDKELPAIGGALTYLYAPYRFSLIFVRGSPEYLAYAILPIVLFFYALCFKSNGKRFVVYAFLAGLTGAILTISHNFAAMFLMPIILAYLIIKIWLYKFNLSKIAWIAFSFLSSFGLGSFFIGPALMEQKFTQIGLNFIQWREHFPTLGQLLKSNWGYFYSSLGTANDGMSFMLGYAQWLIIGIGGIFILFILVQIFRKKVKLWESVKENIWVIFYLVASLFTIYLILPISIPLWEKIKPLQEIQFSWRLLGVAVFTTSALFSFTLAKIRTNYVYIALFVGVSFLTVFGTRNFMLPQPVSSEDVYRYTDYEKLHPHRYSTTTLGDDVISAGAKKACWFSTPPVSTNVDEKIDSVVVEKGNTFGSIKFSIDKNKIKGDKIVIRLGYFPDIHNISLNGGSYLKYSNCNGQVCFDAGNTKDGENFVSWKVGQSKIESTFNYLTVAFLTFWLMLLVIFLTGINKDRKKLIYFVLLAITFFIFMFFRSYNLLGRVGFGWDQERDALATTNILAGKFTLLGPRVQGPAGFFLPPYFFYMLAPFYKLFNLSPLATGGFIVFWSILTFVVSYLVISKVFNKKTALIFLALWAVNPLSVSVDTIAWNPVMVPLLFVVLIYLIYLYLKKTKAKYIFLTGIIFGMGLSSHLQFLLITPVFIPLLIDIFKNKRLKDVAFLVLGSVIPFFPILLFDLRHNFLNLGQIAGLVKSGGEGASRVMIVWERASSFMVGGSPSVLLGTLIYLIVSIGLFIIAKRIKNIDQGKILLSLGSVWVTSLPLFYILIKSPSEYYFNYLLIPFIFFISLLLKNLKSLGVLILAGIMIYFIFQARPLLKDVALSLREKEQAVSLLSKVTQKSSPFNISFDVPFNEDTGFRYLLNYYKINYSGSPNDPLIEFVIPRQKRPVTFAFTQIGIFIPPQWMKTNWSVRTK